MKKTAIMIAAFLAMSQPIFAKNVTVLNPDSGSGGGGDSNSDELVKRLTFLGGYLGYDITADPTQTTPPTTISHTLLNPNENKAFNTILVKTFLAAQPFNTALGQAALAFVPVGVGFDDINKLANIVFSSQNSGSNQNGITTTSTLIDQKPYQADPVSQGIVNILGTPGFDYCKDSRGNLQSDCLFQTKVFANVIVDIPDPTKFATFANNTPPFVSQLNPGALLAPLDYTQDSNTGNQAGGGQSGQAGTENNQGLVSTNQKDTAANFIRYATALANPIGLADYAAYNKIYQNLFSNDPATQLTAKEKLTRYLSSLRVYTAQTSVGISNLYYIFAKRLPPTTSVSDNANSQPQSQALTEFNMATRRLFNANTQGANKDKSPPWIDQINNASPATVQKEIALLLAEINYQMYLNRQQEERMLLTNSLMLMITARQFAPDPSMGGTQ